MSSTLREIVYQITGKDNTAGAWASVKSRVSKEMAGVESSVRESGGRISTAFAAIGVSLSVAGFAAWQKGIIDTADDLNDLSQKLGISIQNLAAYQLAADQSGTSIESVGKGVKSLAKYMVEHNDALKGVGISASTADDALLQVADIFKAMPDSVEKTTLATELFGKAGMELIPMLNLGSEGLRDSKEKTQAYGEALAQIAPDADRFNDTLAELKLNTSATGINITRELLPSLNNLADALNTPDANGKRLASTIGSTLVTAFQTIVVLGLEVAYVFDAIGTEIGGIAAQLATMARGDFKGAFGIGGIGDMMTADAERKRAEHDARIEKFMAPPAAAAVAVGPSPADASAAMARARKLIGGSPSKAKKAGAGAKEDLNAGFDTAAAKAYADTIKDLGSQVEATQVKSLGLNAAQSSLYKLMTSPEWERMPQPWREVVIAQFEAADAAERAAQSEATLAEAYDRSIQPLRDRVGELSREVDLYGLTESQINSTIAARIEEGIVIAQANGASEEQLVFLRQEAQLRREIATVASAKGVLDTNAKAAEDSKKAWEKAADDINRSMTDSLFQAMESNKPIAQAFAESFGNALKTTLLRAVSDSLMAPIRSVLSQLVSSAGPALASMLTASANGNAFGPSGMMAFATGGVVSGATAFRYAGGLGVMGEAGPEAILPLTRTSSGDLGVKAQGGNVGAVSIRVELDNQSSQPAQATSSSTRFDGESFIVSVVLRDLNNNGPIRQTLGG